MSRRNDDAVRVEVYKSERARQKGIVSMGRQGYLPTIERIERPRRKWGFLLGGIGYWMIPPKTRITVTFTRSPETLIAREGAAAR